MTADEVEAEIVRLLRDRREKGEAGKDDVVLLDKKKWNSLYRLLRPENAVRGTLEIDGVQVWMSRFYKDIIAVVPARLIEHGIRGLVIVAEA